VSGDGDYGRHEHLDYVSRSGAHDDTGPLRGATTTRRDDDTTFIISRDK